MLWIKKRTRKNLIESAVWQLLRRVGGKLKVPRKSHVKKDPTKANVCMAELPARLTELGGSSLHSLVRLWVLDEHRYGLVAGDPSGLGPTRCAGCMQPLRHPATSGATARGIGSDRRSPCVRTIVHDLVIDRDVHALSPAISSPTQTQRLCMWSSPTWAGFHLPTDDARIPANLPDRHHSPAPTVRNSTLSNALADSSRPPSAANRLYPNLRKLEDHLPWRPPGLGPLPAGCCQPHHDRLADKANV